MNLFLQPPEQRFACLYAEHRTDVATSSAMATAAADALARDTIAEEYVAATGCSPYVPTVAKMVLERARLHNTYTPMPHLRDLTFWIALQIAQKIVGGHDLVGNDEAVQLWHEARPDAPRVSNWAFMQLELDMLLRTRWRVVPRAA